jgi:hypothetical protein
MRHDEVLLHFVAVTSVTGDHIAFGMTVFSKLRARVCVCVFSSLELTSRHMLRKLCHQRPLEHPKLSFPTLGITTRRVHGILRWEHQLGV